MASKSSTKYRKTSPLVPKSPTSPASSNSSSHASSFGFGSASRSTGRSLPPTPGIGRNLSPSPFAQPRPQYGYPEVLATDRTDYIRAKESVTVTVRLRPLSAREIQKGDEMAWYADGDTTVRNEYNPLTAYIFDRVFGPATTTRHVYDVAAQHVVSGAMEGVNGTVFAYGVTSSGKTHTMHGDQKSPGIIPLAVKDVFSIIQETPDREFLLRVSYLEIYNEVINDLLDPAGQNLRIREDAQGTFVEGIKEEVVLSPAHALSLIAAGEEHRHVGSNNFNLLSSRSHTIFTLTVESSPRGENKGEEDVTLSQLNLIDLAGSESSKTETTGLRRKEGSYINKSLLTLGTVIAKLTDGKATHVPYRDSKLTRLLQSSLSGHGRVSLICTVTPASSSTEETHNTLKFAHRTKHVEIQASQNKIIDEKSLIKKYQKEILKLKQELDQLKRGITEQPYLVASDQDLVSLKQQLKAGQVKLQSRLEEEEQEKAALMGRIQRLTKLILVSTKNTIPSNIPERSGHRRRHSFGEEELAYLPNRRRDFMIEEDDSHDSEFSTEGKGENNIEDSFKEEKKNKKHGMLNWFKLRKRENGGTTTNIDNESSPTSSSVSGTPSSLQADSPVDSKTGRRKSVSLRVDDVAPIIDSFPERTQAGDLFSATVRGRRLPPTGTTMADQMDLLREQVKMLAGEVALCTSSLKRLSEQAASNPDDLQLQAQMQNLKDEIQEKKRQMQVLERRMVGSIDSSPNTANIMEMSQTISKITAQLNEKTFELEIKSADNRVLQEQLQAKISELNAMQEEILLLRQQLNSAMKKRSTEEAQPTFHSDISSWLNPGSLSGELRSVEENLDADTPVLTEHLSRASLKDVVEETPLQSQVLMQAAEIENLKQDKVRLIEQKDGLEVHSQKLAEEAAYAKELASAAAVELKALAEEVTKLSYQNAKLTSDLQVAQDLNFGRAAGSVKYGQNDQSQDHPAGRRGIVSADIRRDLIASHEREAALETILMEKEQKEAEVQKRIEEAKQREADLENELANMWVLVAKLKKGQENLDEDKQGGLNACRDCKSRSLTGDNNTPYSIERNNITNETRLDENEVNGNDLEELKVSLEYERQRRLEVESILSQLKSENLDGLDLATLDELQSLHVDAITKLCHAKVRMHERPEKEGFRGGLIDSYNGDCNNNFCKVCFVAQTAAVLLPCRHFVLCKTCAVACTECPLCRCLITDRIMT